MVKNESKIIQRAMKSCIDIVDAVCIADTGSTDNTVEVATTFLTERKIPFNIVTDPWKNFGHNRTLSFLACQKFCTELEWDPATSWALLLDADMQLRPSPLWSRNVLTQSGHKIMQKAGNLEYFNTRFLRIGLPWKCVGATHEYWEGENLTHIPSDIIHIDDVGDGGAKADKFERDIRLLTESMKENPDTTRTYFYLAQSYHCIHDNKNSLEYYKKRSQMGGWYEEVWYSKYMMVKILLQEGKYSEAESVAESAMQQMPTRSEVMYVLTKYFRQKSDHFKAYHYLQKGLKIKKPEAGLFIETDVYKFLFMYEKIILDYYVCTREKSTTLGQIVQYMNLKDCHHYDNVLSNMKFYLPVLSTPTNTTAFCCPNKEPYSASSSSLLVLESGVRIMNVRYVNYSMKPDGSYVFRDPEGKCRTRNYCVYLDGDNKIISHYLEMQESLPELESRKRNTTVYGLEDLRLFEHNNQLYFTAASKEYSEQIRILMGKYDPEHCRISDTAVLEPPTHTDCEKNWIPVSNGKSGIRFLYQWHPLKVGVLNENKLEIVTEHPTPCFFRDARGSSGAIVVGDELWIVLHKVCYSTPRYYCHFMVVLDRTTLKPKRFSIPFVFKENGIEYCLSFYIKEGTVFFVFSRNDSNPSILSCDMKSFSFVDVVN